MERSCGGVETNLCCLLVMNFGHRSYKIIRFVYFIDNVPKLLIDIVSAGLFTNCIIPWL